MKRRAALASIGFMTLTMALPARAANAPETKWIAEEHYSLIRPAQPTSVPRGKVEVLEIFSYGCPYCNRMQSTIEKLKAALPSNAQVVYLPASFIPQESWPLFQQIYFTSQALGVADKMHGPMFQAVWGPGGELAIVDARDRKLKPRPPTLEDAARFFAKHAGVKEKDFLAAAGSFSVKAKMNQADKTIKDYRVFETPTLIVNGKYRIDTQAVKSPDEIIALVRWLVQKETT